MAEMYPWIEIDLGSSQKVSRIVVQHRQDCCQGRLYTFDILADGSSIFHRSALPKGKADSIVVDNINRSMRYVRLAADNTNRGLADGYHLHIGELTVYSGDGTKPPPPVQVCKDSAVIIKVEYQKLVWAVKDSAGVVKVCK